MKRNTDTMWRSSSGGAPARSGTPLSASLHPPETLGSWFRATARLHGCSRWALAQALAAERDWQIPIRGIDWNLQRPVELMDALGRGAPAHFLTELRRQIPAAHRDLLRYKTPE